MGKKLRILAVPDFNCDPGGGAVIPAADASATAFLIS
jgi:hypothetical protein